MSAVAPGRRWLVPELVQTSMMDCGPAALATLLAGHGIAASYGRLREACQTSVDGTSIDVIEAVAAQLGLDAEQVMLPIDVVPLAEAAALPALVVVRLPAGATHFIVLWNQVGPWVQVMDPGVGRRWRHWRDVAHELYLHQMPVPAAAWREWAASPEALASWRRLLTNLGIPPASAVTLVAQAQADLSWRSLATLDAATRLAGALVRAGGLARGEEPQHMIEACLEQARAGAGLPVDIIPRSFWSITSIPQGQDDVDGEEMVLLSGAVLIRVRGRRQRGAHGEEPALAPELDAALQEPPSRPGRLMWHMVRQDGWLSPLLLSLAVGVAAAGVTAEALLLQGLIRSGASLWQSGQRGGALAALMVFLLALWAVELLTTTVAWQIGGRLELRLRLALLEKIPRLGARYFHSRLISDMAARAHNLRQLRSLPPLISRMISVGCRLLLTLAGLIWLNPSGVAASVGLMILFVLLTVALGRAVSEVEQRLDAHDSALRHFSLDALLGLVPLRLHGAERAMQREHERLLAAWWGAGGAFTRVSVAVQALSGLLYAAFALSQVVTYLRAGGASDNVLLLLYWALSLPVLAQGLLMLSQQYPALRARVLSLIEPLGAPDEDAPRTAAGPPAPADGCARSGVAIELVDVTVRAGGHVILEQVMLRIAPGEHVAIVGRSGAGKSSLAGLLLGWHTPDTGQLLVDGHTLDSARLQALRRTTAWVDPGVQLWNRPLLDNLSYGRETSGADSTAVLAQADLLDVLERLPGGMQTPLGEGGGLVSGGEGQRVRLARAMGRPEARLVVLDEPFRGLDRGQRATLLTRARTLWADATLLCITHDVAETASFDRVLVIEGGRLVEDGSPAALASSPASRYRTLLEAEARVRREGWEGPGWRQARLDNGRLMSDNEGGEEERPHPEPR